MINIVDAVETKLGQIKVIYSADKYYPGYLVQLVKDGEELACVLFEVDESDEDPVCKIHVWDTTQEDPVCDLRGCCCKDELRLERYE